MGTRASIQFRDGDEVYYIYRGHDGYPENVDQDIKEVLEKVKGRWSDPECGTLAAFFIGYWFNREKRLPDYELTPSLHGDEQYIYYITWNQEEKRWEYYYV